jgi:hypothetical protein
VIIDIRRLQKCFVWFMQNKFLKILKYYRHLTIQRLDQNSEFLTKKRSEGLATQGCLPSNCPIIGTEKCFPCVDGAHCPWIRQSSSFLCSPPPSDPSVLSLTPCLIKWTSSPASFSWCAQNYIDFLALPR